MDKLRSVCLCIDDFGLHEGVNEAALALVRDDRVHALSCQVGGPAWASGALALRAAHLARPVDVGLHLDFSQYPLTMAPQSWSTLWLRGAAGRLSDAALGAEVAAQLDDFEHYMGRGPDFVDGHQHVHQFPQVRDALVDQLMRRYPDRKPWLRSTRAAQWQFKAMLIGRLGARALMTQADVRAFAHNRRLLGVYDFEGGAVRYEQLFQRWLWWSRHGDLLMCHPSTRPVPGDPIAQARLWEYQVLSADRFDWTVRSSFVRLDAMSRIAALPRRAIGTMDAAARSGGA